MMTLSKSTFTAALAAVTTVPAYAAPADEAPAATLEAVTVAGVRPGPLPARTPATIEGASGAEIEQSVNAIDSEDALKYLPSLTVRKRYIGDYDHAVLASRASGTGNSARSLVYADGVLISNLLGNGATYTPRWGLLTPEEIERVDVMYGPFAAAYSGNSVGAVVSYVTRMPSRFEGHAKVAAFSQRFEQYGTDASYRGEQASASLGNRHGNWSWWLNVNRLDSDGQPLAFASKKAIEADSDGQTPAGGTPVSGAVPYKNPKNEDWLILGATHQVHTVQNHAKFKLAYDISPGVRALYTLGWWRNEAQRSSQSYLRDSQGNAVYRGDENGLINIGGAAYELKASDFAPSRGELEHLMHGLSLKSTTRGLWDWEIAASVYDYAKDRVRTPTGFLPAAQTGGPGRIVAMQGSGWNTLSLKASWRPDGRNGAHSVEMGYQRERFRLRTSVWNTGDWIDGGPVGRYSAFQGDTQLDSLYLQDAWRVLPKLKTTLGARLEQWRAFNGSLADADSTQPFARRKQSHFSPKAALSYQVARDWRLKAALGRAVRMPTVSELYQGSIEAGSLVDNDPALKPERSWTGELTAERDLDNGIARATVFGEDTRDALYAQINHSGNAKIATVQNVDHIRTLGLELAYRAQDVYLPGLDLGASLTYADSEILRNDAFPDSIGKRQPRVPRWRAHLLAGYRIGESWAYTLGARYSGRQYNTLDNSDQNGNSYTGVSRFVVLDLRARYRLAERWSAAVGIDNLNNEKYWAYHPYTQRTFVAEVKFDL